MLGVLAGDTSQPRGSVILRRSICCAEGCAGLEANSLGFGRHRNGLRMDGSPGRMNGDSVHLACFWLFNHCALLASHEDARAAGDRGAGAVPAGLWSTADQQVLLATTQRSFGCDIRLRSFDTNPKLASAAMAKKVQKVVPMTGRWILAS